MKTEYIKIGTILAVSTVVALAAQGGTVSFESGFNAFTMDFATIGSPENAAQSAANRDHAQGGGDGLGAVDYAYDIGVHEVTIDQFAKADAESGNMIGDGDEGYWLAITGVTAPATQVSFHEAARFCNWLTSGNTTNGAYQIDGSGNVVGIDRGTAVATYGTVYALPVRDEWHKAAYYDTVNAKYTLYAFGTNATPVAGTDATYNNLPAAKTWTVGSGNMEQNGTYDMMGNIWEWCETLRNAGERRLLGGNYQLDETYMESDFSSYATEDGEDHRRGFRVVKVQVASPEVIATFGSDTNVFSMVFSTIGSLGNADQNSNNVDHIEYGGNGWGSVDYAYDIGVYEVTIDQFIKADTESGNTIGNGNENHWQAIVGLDAPAANVNFHESAKFCNWLTSGNATNGAYQIDGSGKVAGIDRTAAEAIYGRVYALPSMDEWHKAAYFDTANEKYTLYAFGNTAPVAGTDATYSNTPAAKTWVAGSGNKEQNGTYDMMGNVFEWIELQTAAGQRRARGGNYQLGEAYLESDYSASYLDTREDYRLGFRVVVIGTELADHEPSTIVSLSPYSGNVLKMVINCPTPWSSYPKTKTDLVIGSFWDPVGHSSSGSGPFTTNNLGTVPGTITIYLEANGAAAFYGIGEK